VSATLHFGCFKDYVRAHLLAFQHRICWLRVCASAALATSLGAPPASASETRGFVVSWWHLASSMEGGDDCPEGINPGVLQVFGRVLRDAGLSPEEVEKRVAQAGESAGGGGYVQYMMMRGRDENGKPIDVYKHPESVPDPNLKRSQSKIGYGFNLDDRISPDDFTDPQTGETGVDNQLYRAMGCIDTFRADLRQSRPNAPSFIWDVSRAHAPAWLIEVTGIDDLQNDDDVEVSIYEATTPITKGATGEVLPNMSMYVDVGSRTNVHLKGTIKDGTLVTAPAPIDMVTDPYVAPSYHFRNARMRFSFQDDGGIKGVVGGFHDWLALFWGGSGMSGWQFEYFHGADFPGLYYAIKKSADADPDPITKQNKMISASYWMEAVPAFVIHPQTPKLSQAARK
jgi:hypothetical protein